MQHVSTSTTLLAKSVLSEHVDPIMAAEQSCDELNSHFGEEQIDLVLAFVSGAHVPEFRTIGQTLRDQLDPGMLVGISAGGVVCGDREIENRLSMSLLALSMPRTSLTAFTYNDLPHISSDSDSPELRDEVQSIIGGGDDLRGVIFFADPFSVPVASALETIGAAPCMSGRNSPPIVGGVASAGAAPGQNMLLLGDRVMRSGGIGISIRGDIAIETLVSQGCRPIGEPMIITDAKRNVIKTLGGRSALDVLQETIGELSPSDRHLVQNGMFLGRVVDEYKERFGRGDFLIRNVLGADQRSGAIALADLLRVGQTVQFHVRDSRTAQEDLNMLLDVQRLRRPAAAGLLVTCSGRGEAFFGHPNHDAGSISRALVGPDGATMPLAGFFAAGEIGPVGSCSHVHGHTACLTLFRTTEKGFEEA